MPSFCLTSSEFASPAINRSLLRVLKPSLCVARPLNIVNRPFVQTNPELCTGLRSGGGQERAGVQCCVWSSRWQFVSLFLSERRREALQWGRKEWLQRIKKKDLWIKVPSGAETLAWSKSKGLFKVGCPNQSDWDKIKKKTNKQKKTLRVCVWESFFSEGESVRDKDSDLDGQTVAAPERQTAHQFDWQINGGPSGGTGGRVDLTTR